VPSRHTTITPSAAFAGVEPVVEAMHQLVGHARRGRLGLIEMSCTLVAMLGKTIF
jgi:hypothetical protein